jgi:zf-MYND-like zinc finger, mRNA-binding
VKTPLPTSSKLIDVNVISSCRSVQGSQRTNRPSADNRYFLMLFRAHFGNSCGSEKFREQREGCGRIRPTQVSPRLCSSYIAKEVRAEGRGARLVSHGLCEHALPCDIGCSLRDPSATHEYNLLTYHFTSPRHLETGTSQTHLQSNCNANSFAMDQAAEKPRKCPGVDCENDASTLKCPTCLKQEIETCFCSQDCFKRSWVGNFWG